MANKKSKAKATNIPADGIKTVKSSVSASKDQNMISTTNVSVNKFFENLDSQFVEKQELVESSGHRNISSNVMVDGEFFVQLDPVINNYEVDRPTSFDNQEYIQRAAAYSKTPKIRTRKSPNSKFDPLVHQYVDAVGIAKEKANARQLTHSDITEPVYPDTANFLLNLNISGHVPLTGRTRLRKVEDWRNDDRQGFIPDTYVTKSNRTLSVIQRNSNIPEITGRFNTFDTRNDSLFRGDESAISLDFVNHNIPFNESAAQAPDRDAFLLDVDTNNFMIDYNKVKSNIKKTSFSSKLPHVVSTDDYIYGKLMSDIDFATFLYILFDSWYCNFSWQSVLEKKLGIIDETMKLVTSANAYVKRNAWDRLKNMARIFEYIPVNKRVIDVWNTVKNASKLGRQDINSEGSILLTPHFQIMGNFFSQGVSTDSNVTTDDPIEYYDISSGIGNPIFRVPIVNFLEIFLDFTRNFHNNSYYKAEDNGNFTGGAQTVSPHRDVSRFADRLTISAVRMTSLSCNILMSILNRDLSFNFINDIIVQYGEFYSTLKEAGVYAGTGFEFMTPSIPSLFTRSEPVYSDSSAHKQYLMDPNPRYGGIETAPIISTDSFNLGYYYNMHHSFIYDVYGKNMYIPKLVKAFIVHNYSTNDNDNPSNGGVENDIKADFDAVVLTSSILIPFFDRQQHHFSMNTTPASLGSVLVFNNLVDELVFLPPCLFEFVKYSDGHGLRMHVNMTDNIRHISAASPAFNYYLTTDRLASFFYRSPQSAVISLTNVIGIPGSVASFRDQNLRIQANYDNLWSYEQPQVCTYRASWVSRSFGAKTLNADSFMDSEVLTPDSISVTHNNDDIKSERIE